MQSAGDGLGPQSESRHHSPERPPLPPQSGTCHPEERVTPTATRPTGGTAGKPSTTTTAQRAPPGHAWCCAQVTPGLGLFPGLGPGPQSTGLDSTGNVRPGASKILGPLTTQIPGVLCGRRREGNVGSQPEGRGDPRCPSECPLLGPHPSRMRPHTVFLEPQHSSQTLTKQMLAGPFSLV